MGIAITFAGLACAGLFIGACSGLLGIGGGTLMVPILRLAFGLSAIASSATSLFTMAFTSASGAVTHVRNRTCIPALGVALGIGGCLTSALGVKLASISPSWAIMLAAAVIIAYSAYNMLRKALALPRGGGKGADAGQRDVAQARQCTDSVAGDDVPIGAKALAAGAGIGLLAGLCAGYVGVGGGFIMVPLMTSWLGVPMKKASGTSLIAIIILAIPGIIGHVMLGNVDYLAGIALAVGSIPGAVVGAQFAKRVPERQLRFMFAAFLGLGAVLLVANELGVF